MLPLIVLGVGAYLLYKELTEETQTTKPKKRSKEHETVPHDGNGRRTDNGGRKPSPPVKSPGGVTPKPKEVEKEIEPLSKDCPDNGNHDGNPEQGQDASPDDSSADRGVES